MSGYRSKSARRDASPTNLKNLLAGNTSLHALHRHAAEVSQLQNALWPFLPPSLRPHCKLANYRDSTLFLHADSPVWAAKARHASPQILHTARVRCKISARKLVVRVRWTPNPAASTKPVNALGKAASIHLEQAAEHCPDPDIAATLQRIARRRSTKS
ncbi:MAG: DciA family protein [Lysobacterales bacterium]